MKKRQISEKMLNAFLSGELSSLLEAVKKDDTLDLELRGDSVNIYYRGGSIFKIEEINNSFSISFDTNYCTEDSASLAEIHLLQKQSQIFPFISRPWTGGFTNIQNMNESSNR